MANRYLPSLFEKIFDCPFDKKNQTHRFQLQHSIYLLATCGFPVWDYGYRWYRNGPIATDLISDIFDLEEENQRPLKLYAELEQIIQEYKDIINSTKKGNYSLDMWIRCIASLKYLKNNKMDFDSTPEEVVAELERRMPYLNNHEVNLVAYQVVCEQFRL